MTWNYRAILHDKAISGPWIGLHEVYYDKTGAVTGWTEKPTTFVCDPEEGAAGIVKSLQMAVKDASTRLMLIESDIVLAP